MNFLCAENQITRAWDILDRVGRTSSRTGKESLLNLAKEDEAVSKILREFFVYSCDPYMKFGIDIKPKDFPMSLMGGDTQGDENSVHGWASLWWEGWTTLLDRLVARELTGHAARDAVVDHLLAAGPTIYRWAMPMFRRVYNIGVGTKTINKLWPGAVRGFDCQLASKWDKETVPRSAIVEPKLDGLRGLIFLDPDNPRALSRNGKQLFNVSHILDELMPLAEGYVIDGEFYSQDWASSMSAVKKKEAGITDARLSAFDIIPIADFEDQSSNQILFDRRSELRSCLGEDTKTVSIVEGIRVTSPDEVMEASMKFLAAGYEGGILKDLAAPYSYSRKGGWSKIKKTYTEDLKVVGYKEGSGKLEGSLGALIVEDLSSGLPVLSGVGTGLSEVLRAEVWARQEFYLGKIVEVAFQEKTPDGVLRFPVFMKWRLDKS